VKSAPNRARTARTSEPIVLWRKSLINHVIAGISPITPARIHDCSIKNPRMSVRVDAASKFLLKFLLLMAQGYFSFNR
jgi:hypothetical protein